MIKKILIFITILALLSTMLLPLLASTAHAADTSSDSSSSSSSTEAAGSVITPAPTVTVPGIPQPEFMPGPTTSTTGSGAQDYLLNTGIPKAINIAIGLLGITAFLGILLSAIQMLTAYGAEDKLTRAKTNLRYSLLGFLIVILSYAIVSIVVSLALPNVDGTATDSTSTSWIVPSAYAVDVTKDPSTLMPNEQVFIEDQDSQGRVSLPNGNFLSEIVPAVITNVMYLVGFLIFIGFMYGGTLMVIGRGNEEEAGKAKSIVMYSAIALALVSLGYAIIYGIATLNLNNDSTTTDDNVYTDTSTN